MNRESVRVRESGRDKKRLRMWGLVASWAQVRQREGEGMERERELDRESEMGRES